MNIYFLHNLPETVYDNWTRQRSVSIILMEMSVWYQEAERVVYQGLGIRPLLLHSVCQSVIKHNAELVMAGKQNKSAVQICICMIVAVAKTNKKK